MFEKISKRKLKGLMLWKYLFQLLLTPIILSILMNLLFFIEEWIRLGINSAISLIFHKHEFFGLIIPGGIGFSFLAIVCNLVNILSVVPFIKLLIDCMSKADEETKEIEVYNTLPPYELQCYRQSKRFISDTFSRKENIEMFIYDENKTKYRFFWNENYGEKVEESKICQAKRMRISYFKHSKIIFRCENSGVRTVLKFTEKRVRF